MKKQRGKRSVLKWAATALVGALLISSGITAQAQPEDHIIQGISPSNTKINLFDYWLTTQEGGDGGDPFGMENMAINKEHYLKFSKNSIGNEGGIYGNASNTTINAWTGKRTDNGRGGPYAKVGQSMVQNTLENGYPMLNSGLPYTKNEVTKEQSLAYLFDYNPTEGKAIYTDVKNLLQLDENGYYYYDSKKNFAEFDEENNQFNLYDTSAVLYDPNNIADQQSGQFFPFDTAKEVFVEENGELKSNILSTNGKLNHYFGMHMTSYFMQPDNGTTANGEEMSFHFSGDDDVWLFIDGVLVGDVGGRHDRLTLDINFKTGSVVVKDGSSYQNNGSNEGRIYIETTIGEMFRKARKTQAIEGDTFRDETYHTLDFFYLERGNGNSNLSLSTNLVSVPSSDIIKVDQTGDTLDGAEFVLYSSNKDYTEKKEKVATGTTSGGMMTFMDENNRVINFSELYNSGAGHQYYILEETFAPAGYRKVRDVYLWYEPRTGTLFSENGWESGALASGKEIITADTNEVQDINGNTYEVTSNDQMFAVILKRNENVGVSVPADEDGWSAVSGDAVHGYVLTDIQTLDDIDKVPDDSKYQFEKGADGKYQVQITELPGDLRSYYYMLGKEEKKDTEYSVGYYYRDEKGILHRLSSSYNLKREFGTRIYITDPVNYLFVQKVDDEGTPVNGAKFGLFSSGDVEIDPDTGTVTIPEGKRPLRTVETKDMTQNTEGIKLNGMAYFDRLEPGTYYMKELSAPNGYFLNSQIVSIIVDENGVHADAGKEKDGISTIVGVGTLLDSMVGYASNGDINRTLSDIIVSKRTGALSGNSLTWESEQDVPELKLSYGKRDAILEYGPSKDGDDTAFVTEAGWSWFKVEQNYEDPGMGIGSLHKEDIRGIDLTNLYTGTTTVRVEDQRESSLEIAKIVEIPDGLSGPDQWEEQEFPFTISLTPAPGEKLKESYKMKLIRAGQDSIQQIDLVGEVKNGEIKQSLKSGDTLQIFGLAEGTTYEVKEEIKDPMWPEEFRFKDVAGTGKPEPLAQRISGTIPEAGKKELAYFYNEYHVEPVKVSETIKARKVFDHWGVAKDGFEIRLESIDGAPLPKPSAEQELYEEGIGNINRGIKVNVKNGNEIVFGEITYDRPGDYKYVIYEKKPVTSQRIPGVDYSYASYEVTVHVTDRKDGHLQAETEMIMVDDDNGQSVTTPQVISDNVAVITNGFAAESIKIGLLGKKYYTQNGEEMSPPKGKFVFALDAVERYGNGTNQEIPMPEGAVDSHLEVANADDGGVTFGAMEFTEADVGNTYVYKVSEVVPQNSEGIQYDLTEYYAHIKVTSEEHEDPENSGQNKPYVKAVITYKDSPKENADALLDSEGNPVTQAIFINHYHALPTEAEICGVKRISGREWLDQESYTFNLTADDRILVQGGKQGTTADALKNGNVIFDGKPGEEETTVEVTGIGSDPAEFAFGKIQFKKAGRYTFYVNEEVPKTPSGGMTYDAHTATVTVQVTDGGVGNLNAAVTYNNRSALTEEDKNLTDKAGFTNSYRTSMIYDGIEVRKTMHGRDLNAQEFAFIIEAMDTPNSTTKEEAEQYLTDADRRFENGKWIQDDPYVMEKMKLLSFTQAEAGKSYTYKVYEYIPNEAAGETKLIGVIYDQSEYQIRIDVKDEKNGQMYTETTVSKIKGANGTILDAPEVETYDSHNPGVPTVSFENNYQPNAVTVADAPLVKTLIGRDWTAQDEFRFELTTQNGAPMPQHTQITVTEANASGFGFGPMIYTIPGIYEYTVREIIPDTAVKELADGTIITYKDATPEQKEEGGFSESGITYCNTEAYVTIQVEDFGTGQLFAFVSVEYSDNAASFENVYREENPPKYGALAITKTVEVKPEQGTVIDETKEFTFTVDLRDTSSGSGQSELNGTYDYTITNADGTPVLTDGKLKSGDSLKLKHGQEALITGIPDGSGYTVTEAEIADDGYTAKEQVIIGTISGDTSNGQSGIVTAAFCNAYDVSSVNVTIEATKKLAYFGQETEPGTLKADQFSFELSGDDLINPMIASNDADGKITFADIPLKRAGIHTFTLKETPGNIGGVTYDPAIYTVTIEVTDEKNGMLTAGAPIYSKDGETAGELIFTNDYHAEFGEMPTIRLQAVKELSGRELKSGEFQFVVTDANGTEVSKAANKVDGTVVFPEFGFDGIGENPTPEQMQSLIGEHWYTIKESGNDGNGVLYDRTVYLAKVVVTDNGEGTLAVSEPQYYAEDQVTQLDQVVFHNSYTAAPVNATIQAEKILLGKDLTEGEFTFALYENDIEIARVSNDGEGKIRFDLTYEDESGEGEHIYTLAEVKGEAAQIVYDETIYTIQVRVTDDGTGQLKAEVTYPEKGVVFTNKYEEPEVPPTTPPTPDPEPNPSPEPNPNPNPEPESPTPDEQNPGTPPEEGNPDRPNPEQPEKPNIPNIPNKPNTDVPKTGDEANIMPILIVMLIAAVAIIWSVVRGRKRK